jgi:hypothetical protein
LAQSVWQEDAAREPAARPRVRRNNKRRGTRPMQQPRFITARLAVMVLILIVSTNLLLAGGLRYGPIEPFDIVRVTGHVTFDDGTTIPAGRVTVVFETHVPPVNKRTHPRPGFVEIDMADGRFSEATTHRYRDGLIVGWHQVRAWTYDADSNRVPLAIIPSVVEVDSNSTVLEFKIKK